MNEERDERRRALRGRERDYLSKIPLILPKMA